MQGAAAARLLILGPPHAQAFPAARLGRRFDHSPIDALVYLIADEGGNHLIELAATGNVQKALAVLERLDAAD